VSHKANSKDFHNDRWSGESFERVLVARRRVRIQDINRWYEEGLSSDANVSRTPTTSPPVPRCVRGAHNSLRSEEVELAFRVLHGVHVRVCLLQDHHAGKKMS
jgi:hypothetical protein